MIAKTFAYHKPSADGLSLIASLRADFSGLKAAIEKAAPESRERSIAMSRLEESAMWAIKAVVVHDPKSEVSEIVN